MSQPRISPVVLLTLSLFVQAEPMPNSGSQIQQLPPALNLKQPAPTVESKHIALPDNPVAESTRILVNTLKVIDAQIFTETELVAVSGFDSGNQYSIADLREMAVKISDHYHRNGYFVAMSFLPPQQIKAGEVSIKVIEGRYGKITLHNQSPLSDSLANRFLVGLNSGDFVRSAPLEQRLLLLSDLPGVTIKSTLVPGASVGATDLIVDVSPARRVTGSVNADNAGNRYTGVNRVGAAVNLNDPTGRGDVVTLRVLSSGAGMRYARAAYQMQFTEVKAGVAYSHFGYTLGREFESLHAKGTAGIAGIYTSYPLLRSRQNNLYVQLAYDTKTFHDTVDATVSVTDKRARVLMFSMNGDLRDALGGAGMNGFSFTLTTGKIDNQTPAVKSLDALTAQTNGRFNKLDYSAMRLQNAGESLSIYTAINGQLASKNLDVSEKMELGGMYAVRAYPEGEGFADQGYVLTLEARKQLPPLYEGSSAQMQLFGFIDHGNVLLNKRQWEAVPNSRSLSGAGIGFNWNSEDYLVVKAFYAHKLGNGVATSAPDSSGRFWLQAVKYF